MRLLLGPLDASTHRGLLDALTGLDALSFGGAGAAIPYSPAAEPFQRLFERLPAGWTPDALVWWAPEETPVPAGIEACPFPSVAVSPDLALNFWATQHVLGAFDLVLTDRSRCRALEALGLAHAEPWRISSLNATVDPVKPEQPREIDLLLVPPCPPDLDAAPAPWLRLVLALSSRHRVRLALEPEGPGTRELMGRAKIVVTRSAHGELPRWALAAAASGALLFIEAENLEVRDVFIDRTHCVLYRDPELEPLVGYYLEHDAERRTIAEAGWRRVHEDTPGVELERLATRLRDLRRHPPRRPWAALAPTERAYRLGVKAFLSRTAGAWNLAERMLQQAATDPTLSGLAQATLASLYGTASARVADPADGSRLLQLARQHARQALELDRSDPVRHLTAGELAIRAGDATAARGLLLKTVALSTTCPGRGLLVPVPFPFDQDGFRTRWERAAWTGSEAFCAALPSLLAARAWRRLGDLAAESGDPGRAFEALVEAVSAWADLDDSRYELGRLLQSQRHLDDEALTLYRDTVTAFPCHVHARDKLAYLLYNTGRIAESAQVTRETLELLDALPEPSPMRPHFQSFLGSCARRLGKERLEEVRAPATLGTAARVVNKLADTQDLNRLARRAVAHRLIEIKALLDRAGLPYSRQASDHWLRIWEYSGAVVESAVDTRMRVLDAGGTGTVLSYYLAAEGCRVTTVDINAQKLRDARVTTPALGLSMEHVLASIQDLPFSPASFDAVFCICVIEHLPREGQGPGMAELGRVLRPGGLLALTFDYGVQAADNPFLSPQEVVDRLIVPSGLAVLGNVTLDTDPEDFGGAHLGYTFGSLFLAKPGRLGLEPARGPIKLEPFPALKPHPTEVEPQATGLSFSAPAAEHSS